MGEFIAAEIQIGGPVRQRHVAGLCRAIHEAHVEADWGSGRFSPKCEADLLDGRQFIDGSNILQLSDDEANWGEFPSLEKFLRQHRIAFDRFSEGKWEYEPQHVAYRPGLMDRVLVTNPARAPIVPVTMLHDVLAKLDLVANGSANRHGPSILKMVRSARDLLQGIVPTPTPPLPPLEIVYPKSKSRKVNHHDYGHSSARTAPTVNRSSRAPPTTVD